MNNVDVRLVGDTKADVEVAIQMLRRAHGARIMLLDARKGRRGQWLAYGVLAPVEEPEEPEAKPRQR